MSPLLLRISLFCLLAAGLFGGAAASPFFLRQFSRILPDNYKFQAEQALLRKEWSKAEAIAQKQVDEVWWDMDAHYLLARALAGSGRPAAAAQMMLEIQRKVLTAQGRKIQVTGYDEAATILQLAGYLWQDSQYQYAGEMYRLALDAGADGVAQEVGNHIKSLPGGEPAAAEALAAVALKLRDQALFQSTIQPLEKSSITADAARARVLKARWREEVDGDASGALELLAGTSTNAGSALSDEPLVRLATAGLLRRTGHPLEAQEQVELVRSAHGIRPVRLDGFTKLPVGATVSSQTLGLSRRGTAVAQVETGVFRTTSLLLQGRGAAALGQWPILAISAGEQELTRIYLDGLQPRAYDLPLFPEGAPKVLQLGLTFINDAYDPATRADRDIRIDFLAFQ